MTNSRPINMQTAWFLKQQAMYLIVTAGVEEPLQPLPGVSSPPHSFLGAGMMNQHLLPDTHRNKEGHYNLSTFINKEDGAHHWE